jgi:DNA polymerase-3 subunit epsilon
MGLLSRWFRSAPTLDPQIEARLQRLTEMAPPPTRNRHRKSRYVTVDVETTGLDMRRDRVLSIGAVALSGTRIDLAGCFEAVLRQPESSSRENILVHRIGGQRQMGGEDPAAALLRFLEYVGRAPLVAFGAGFGRHMLDRVLQGTLGVGTQSGWIDLARVLPALFPANDCRTMDDWLATMRIRTLARHDALADALATAQMLQVALHAADSVGVTCPAHLIEMQMAQHWLGKH